MNLTEATLRIKIREEILHNQQKKINEAVIGLITEGLYDPGILKAVFMAGGPGSGKSKTASLIFGGEAIENAAMQAGTATGLRVINSDPAFEKFLKDAGISPSELKDMSDEEFYNVTELPGSPRQKAKGLKKVAQSAAMIGRLGLIVDGTGQDLDKMKKKKAYVEKAGYDTMMVFVNTTLEKAQERNLKRERKLKEADVEEIWTNVQANLEAYRSLFGANFQIIDNTDYNWDVATKEAAAAAQAFVASPIKNPIGREWIEQQVKEREIDREDPWVGKKMDKLLTLPPEGD